MILEQKQSKFIKSSFYNISRKLKLMFVNTIVHANIRT